MNVENTRIIDVPNDGALALLKNQDLATKLDQNLASNKGSQAKLEETALTTQLVAKEQAEGKLICSVIESETANIKNHLGAAITPESDLGIYLVNLIQVVVGPDLFGCVFPELRAPLVFCDCTARCISYHYASLAIARLFPPGAGVRAANARQAHYANVITMLCAAGGNINYGDGDYAVPLPWAPGTLPNHPALSALLSLTPRPHAPIAHGMYAFVVGTGIYQTTSTLLPLILFKSGFPLPKLLIEGGVVVTAKGVMAAGDIIDDYLRCAPTCMTEYVRYALDDDTSGTSDRTKLKWLMYATIIVFVLACVYFVLYRMILRRLGPWFYGWWMAIMFGLCEFFLEKDSSGKVISDYDQRIGVIVLIAAQAAVLAFLVYRALRYVDSWTSCFRRSSRLRDRPPGFPRRTTPRPLSGRTADLELGEDAEGVAPSPNSGSGPQAPGQSQLVAEAQDVSRATPPSTTSAAVPEVPDTSMPSNYNVAPDYKKTERMVEPPARTSDEHFLRLSHSVDHTVHKGKHWNDWTKPFSAMTESEISAAFPGGKGEHRYSLTQRFNELGWTQGSFRSMPRQRAVLAIASMLAFSPQPVVDGRLQPKVAHRRAEAEANQFYDALHTRLSTLTWSDVLVFWSWTSKNFGDHASGHSVEYIDSAKAYKKEFLSHISVNPDSFPVGSHYTEDMRRNNQHPVTAFGVIDFVMWTSFDNAANGRPLFHGLTEVHEYDLACALFSIKYIQDPQRVRLAISCYRTYRENVAKLAPAGISIIGAIDWRVKNGKEMAGLNCLGVSA